MFINASGLLVLKLGCHHWSLNFFPPPFLLLFFTLSLPHPNTKYSLSLLLEDFYIYLITLLLTDITLTQTLITLFLEYCKVVFFFVCLFGFFWPHWVFLAVRGLSLAVVSLLPHWVFVAVRGLPLAVVSLLPHWVFVAVRGPPLAVVSLLPHGVFVAVRGLPLAVVSLLPHGVFVAVRGPPLAVVSLLPHWVFVAERGLSPAVVSLLFSCSVQTSPVVASRVAEHGL